VRLDDDSSYNGITGKEAGQLDPGRICFIALDDVRADRSDAEETVIPGKIVRFLEQHANLAFAGTRNRDRVPYGHRVSGWHVGGDARTLTAFVAEQFTPRLVESLEDNGELALTVEEFPSHETYQFKGRYRRHRQLDDEDYAVVGRIRDRFVKSMRHLFADVPEHVLQAYILNPSLAVEFEVREVFVQTPGPGAGTRLVPPPER
jgi:hypothetical protein